MRFPRAVRQAFALLALFSASVVASEIERTGGPYVPTPQAVVDAMLDMAHVSARDFVVDLGSGDGRIVLTAAERYKARGLGIDIDPELVQASAEEARRRGLENRVSFRRQDVLQAKIADASVVTLYLLPGLMQQLQAKFIKELKPGTRIVSHDFPFNDWRPDRQMSVEVPEKYGSPGQWKSTIFFWVVPAAVNGRWDLSAPGLLPERRSLALRQQYQFVEGELGQGATRVPLAEGRLEATRITFKLKLPSGTYAFNGHVDGERMQGEAVLGARKAQWTAERAPTKTARR